MEASSYRHVPPRILVRVSAPADQQPVWWHKRIPPSTIVRVIRAAHYDAKGRFCLRKFTSQSFASLFHLHKRQKENVNHRALLPCRVCKHIHGGRNLASHYFRCNRVSVPFNPRNLISNSHKFQEFTNTKINRFTKISRITVY